MSFDELWDIIDSKNPQIKTGHVKMTSLNFKRAMRLAFEKGVESVPKTADNSIGNIFDGLWKK
jgi:hypothetical protein